MCTLKIWGYIGDEAPQVRQFWEVHTILAMANPPTNNGTRGPKKSLLRKNNAKNGGSGKEVNGRGERKGGRSTAGSKFSGAAYNSFLLVLANNC